MQLHHQGEIPSMKDQGFAIAPGTHTLVGVKRVVVGTTLTNYLFLQALRVPEPPVQSTVTGLIKCSHTNISGDTEHLSKWRPPYTIVI